MNEQDTRKNPRRLSITVYGDTADEIELFALDKARAFFGPDARLEVVKDYGVIAASSGNRAAIESGKGYQASVLIHVIDPA